MRAHSLVACIDCANFYVQCERLFDPSLHRRPVVELSNNDGCVVSRSEEAKALGVAMGVPYFQIRRGFEQAGGVARSSDDPVYGEMSRRVQETIRPFAADLEVYSIDEVFLTLPDVGDAALHALGVQVAGRMLQWTGLPVRPGGAG